MSLLNNVLNTVSILKKKIHIKEYEQLFSNAKRCTICATIPQTNLLYGKTYGKLCIVCDEKYIYCEDEWLYHYNYCARCGLPKCTYTRCPDCLEFGNNDYEHDFHIKLYILKQQLLCKSLIFLNKELKKVKKITKIKNTQKKYSRFL